jgi:TonB family protein
MNKAIYLRGILLLIFILCLIFGSANSLKAQSKKEQIEILSARLDSLSQILRRDRRISMEKNKEYEGEVLKLKSQVEKLSISFQNSTLEFDSLKMSNDSLTSLNESLERIIEQPVTIGNQVWKTKNLNVDKFRNGDPIPQARTAEEWERAGKNKQPAWSYYENNPGNGEKYGKLYNWYAVSDPRGLAPRGWHIPSDEEWATLIDHLGGEDVAGGKMKSTLGWDENGHGTNDVGFTGLPAGYRINNYENKFLGMGSTAAWWSSSSGGIGVAWMRQLNMNRESVGWENYNKSDGYSVRCIKGNDTSVEEYLANQLLAKANSASNEESGEGKVDIVFDTVETQPNFPGGINGWNKYLSENMIYPTQARRMGVEGTVIVVFVINTDGSIQDVEVLRGIGGGCDEEAIKVVKNSPKWEPGKQKGKPVNTRMRLPIRFKLG